MTLYSRKLHLIRQVLQINDEALIDELIAYIKNSTLQQIAKPIRSHFDLEEIRQEQGYKPINIAEFDLLIKELDIQEPLEDLLAMLTK